MQYEFSSQALKQLQKLPKSIQKRIIKKLDHYVKQQNPLRFADYLIDTSIGSYRYRIGDYRVIFDLKEQAIVILVVGYRRDIYR